MKIQLTNVSKRYNYDWIFRHVDYTFESGKHYAITGPNGSGKSTLLKVLSGHLTPSEGTISFSRDTHQVSIDQLYQYVSFSAPYIELIDEFTLDEAIRFHAGFRPFTKGLSVDDVKSAAGLGKHAGKPLKQFSSGMRQRAKLILSILSDSDILLLDEPTTNLDEAGVQWYLQMIADHCSGKLVIVGSNLEREYSFCKEIISIERYKAVST